MHIRKRLKYSHTPLAYNNIFLFLFEVAKVTTWLSREMKCKMMKIFPALFSTYNKKKENHYPCHHTAIVIVVVIVIVSSSSS